MCCIILLLLWAPLKTSLTAEFLLAATSAVSENLAIHQVFLRFSSLQLLLLVYEILLVFRFLEMPYGIPLHSP